MIMGCNNSDVLIHGDLDTMYNVYTTTTTLGCWTLTFATLHLHIQEEELWRLLSPSLALF